MVLVAGGSDFRHWVYFSLDLWTWILANIWTRARTTIGIGKAVLFFIVPRCRRLPFSPAVFSFSCFRALLCGVVVVGHFQFLAIFAVGSGHHMQGKNRIDFDFRG